MKDIKEKNKVIARQFFALSSPIRLQILQLLTEREHCACEFPELLQISQPNASRNLFVLKKAGLITSYRDGQRIIYSLESREIQHLANRLNELIESNTGLTFTLKDAYTKLIKRNRREDETDKQ
ncbi:metalloregulator ArsR/SmtB family transcription factor [bacterium]|nr:metalloregulator ArsR/SmtB family transcription factor [bacterium]